MHPPTELPLVEASPKSAEADAGDASAAAAVPLSPSGAHLRGVFQVRVSRHELSLRSLSVIRRATGSKDIEIASLDRKELCAYTPSGAVLASRPNPYTQGMTTFVASCFHTKFGYHLVAATDMAIWILGETFELLGKVRMGHHVVRDMVYLRQANQILTAGSLGLRAYTLVSCASATGRRWLLELARIYDCEPFASSLRYHERTDCVVVMWPQAACADVFESQGAAAPFRLQGSAMHARSLTDVMQRAFNVISSCAGGSIKVWYREPAEALPRDARRAVTAPRDAHLRHLHSFAGHSRAVSQLAAHPSNAALFFSAALDGAVRLWDVDALVPVAVVVRLAFGTPIVRLRIFEESTLIVQVDDGRVIGYVFDDDGGPILDVQEGEGGQGQSGALTVFEERSDNSDNSEDDSALLESLRRPPKLKQRGGSFSTSSFSSVSLGIASNDNSPTKPLQHPRRPRNARRRAPPPGRATQDAAVAEAALVRALEAARSRRDAETERLRIKRDAETERMRPDWHPAMVAYDVAVNVVETVLEGGLQRALAAVLVLARCPVPDAELSPAGFQGDALCADGEAPAPAPADRAAAKAAKAADRAAADIAFDLALSKLRPLTLTKPQVVTILKHPTPPRSRSAASAVDPRLWLGDVEAAGGGVKCDRVSGPGALRARPISLSIAMTKFAARRKSWRTLPLVT